LNAGTRRLMAAFLLSLAVQAAVPGAAAAQAVRATALFLAGGALGLGMHESGHVGFDAAFGVPPGIRKVTFGPLPFFAITHDPVTPGREFAISSAGFWVQHVTSELILGRRPRLRSERAPLLKGILAFNVLASAAYAGAAFTGGGPPERDTRGMAVSARVAEAWIGAAILAPAALDAGRYYEPDVTWLTWASRGAKVAGALLMVRAANQ
jgi:hypothetical protein